MTIEPKSKSFGILGVIAGFLALITVLVGPSIHDAFFPKPAVEDRIADTAVRIRDRVVARLKHATDAPAPTARRIKTEQLPFTASLALAGVAIVGGCISYLRREDHRYAYVACGVGSLTLAWHAIIISVGAFILIAILFALFSSFGLG